MPFEVSPRALELLGWPELIAALADRTQTDGGRERAERLPFLEGEAELEAALTVAGDALGLLVAGASVGLSGAADVRPHLAYAQKEAVLGGPELWQIATSLGVLRDLQRFCRESSQEAPALTARGCEISGYEGLRRRLEACLEPTGVLRDDASEDLYLARRRVRTLRKEMKQHVEGLVTHWQDAGALQDSYFTIRNERYVLPVRSGDKGRVKGIVHGSSRTGQTLFIEPTALVEDGNALRIAQAEVAEEELRILRDLSGAVGRRAPDLMEDLDVLFEFDAAWAVGRLGRALEAWPASTSPADAATGGALVELRGLRHPLMALAHAAGDGVPVVPNDLVLDPETGAFVITGPNAGGKTVLLKSLGLCALMQRAGLPLPAEEPSRVPAFDALVCVLGDDQSLAKAHSTFSSHVVTISEGYESACRVAQQGGTMLVLLDELVADTDPRQGGALAQAMVEGFVAQGARVVVTTHHEVLKAAATTTPGWCNAAVGFDESTLRPTYRLQAGVPGRSNPFEVAQRFGLDGGLIERARELATEEQDTLSRALELLDASQQEAAAARERAEEAWAEAEAHRKELEAQREAFARQRESLLAEAKTQARAQVESAVEEVAGIIAGLQGGGMRAAVEAQQSLRERGRAMEQDAGASEPSDEAAPAVTDLRPGDSVRVLAMGRPAEGEVLEVDVSRGEALVQVGALRSRFAFHRITRVDGGRGKARRKRQGRRPGRSSGAATSSAPDPVGSRCHLLGQRTEDALAMVESFLDSAFRQDLSEVVIVHGHGTGALKRAVREYLKDAHFVVDFRHGQPEEGGDGVTVVELE